jgi:hypothetical protein
MANQSEAEELGRERARLVRAESDMRQAEAAARHLIAHGAEMNGDAERALVTGMIVTYARCYTTSYGYGQVEGKLATPESPALAVFHKELVERRNDLFAHNDATPFRGEMDIAAHLGVGEGQFVEAWTPIDAASFRSLEQLAAAQRERFRERIDAITGELSGS